MFGTVPGTGDITWTTRHKAALPALKGFLEGEKGKIKIKWLAQRLYTHNYLCLKEKVQGIIRVNNGTGLTRKASEEVPLKLRLTDE